ncbi:MAG: hypothetical protein IPM17_05690 [Verrucomicrobia bacterium]|nr:hypothetical protein [Verrucomicrobiota bacterium]
MKKHRKLTLSLALTVASLMAASAPAAHAALVAHFKLDEGASDPFATSVASVVGGWTGEFYSDPAPTWVTTDLAAVPGGTQAAVAFDATVSTSFDPHIATTFPGITGNGARTVAAWVKGGAVQPNFGVLVSWGRSATAQRYTVRVETAAGANFGKLRLEVQGHAIIGHTVVLDDRWHHVAVTTPASASAHDSALYVDGVLQTPTLFGTKAVLDTQADPAVPGELVHIGNSGHSLAAYGFNGQIDDVRIYDEVLSEAQIKELVFGSGTPPSLSAPLANQTIILGDPAAQATFTAAVSGSPPLSYEWLFNGQVLPGQAGSSLVLNPANRAHVGDYTVRVTNPWGTSSSTARLDLGTGPVEPNRQVGLVGGTAVLTVTMPPVSGYTYQWRKNGSPLPGATSAQLRLADLKLDDAGAYSVEVTLGADVAISPEATVRVLPVPGSAYAAAVLGDSPAAYWRLGEANGATVAKDETGFHDAAYVNYVGFELGMPGALDADPNTASDFSSGTPNYLELPFAAELNDVRAFTLEVWAKPAVLKRQSLICSSFSLPSRGFEIYGNAAGQWVFRTGESLSPATEAWNEIAAGEAIEGEWSHVVATYDGRVKTLYVNGLPLASAAAGILPTLGSVLRVGAGQTHRPEPASVFDGTLDEVAIYRRALSAKEVAAHYRASGRPLEGLLTAERMASGLTLSWEGEGWVLEQSNDVSASWTEVPGAASPHTMTASGAQRFFRLRKP